MNDTDPDRPSKTREECLDDFARALAESEAICAGMSPREQAEAAWTPASPHSVDELEASIRLRRALGDQLDRLSLSDRYFTAYLGLDAAADALGASRTDVAVLISDGRLHAEEFTLDGKPLLLISERVLKAFAEASSSEEGGAGTTTRP
jgi:hypothetical protein